MKKNKKVEREKEEGKVGQGSQENVSRERNIHEEEGFQQRRKVLDSSQLHCPVTSMLSVD